MIHLCCRRGEERLGSSVAISVVTIRTAAASVIAIVSDDASTATLVNHLQQYGCLYIMSALLYATNIAASRQQLLYTQHVTVTNIISATTPGHRKLMLSYWRITCVNHL